MTRDLLLALLALLLGTVAVARASRLMVHDDWPPAVALRRWWFNATAARGGWRESWAPVLVGKDGGPGCPFCFAPYAALVNLGWALAVEPWRLASSDPWSAEGWWWVVNVWAAVSYGAAMLVARDEPPEED